MMQNIELKYEIKLEIGTKICVYDVKWVQIQTIKYDRLVLHFYMFFFCFGLKKKEGCVYVVYVRVDQRSFWCVSV